MRFLAQKRASLAKARGERHLLAGYSDRARRSYLKVLELDREENTLVRITPPRRQWVQPGLRRRYRNGQGKSAIERNTDAVYRTMLRDRASDKPAPYVVEQDRFIREVRASVSHWWYRIAPPEVRPELKEFDKGTGQYTYRPLCSYSLKDNLVISFVNRYLTELLDPTFYAGSFAFRSRRDFGGELRTPNHHDAFQTVVDFSTCYRSESLFVAECDMKKFFDTVGHKVVVDSFRKAMKRLPAGTACDHRAFRILKSYLASYSFPECVEVRNHDHEFFKRFRMKPGEFPWLRGDIAKAYPKFPTRAIGIPQGGALSGLIANLVLSEVDRRMESGLLGKGLYTRYCDDMILMTTDLPLCKSLLSTYQDALMELKLFPHRPENGTYGPQFWKFKTKGPYEWSGSCVPWVGFVGYEIDRNGNVRVRKKSIGKELEKQRELVRKFRDTVRDVGSPEEAWSLARAVAGRLVGMSVGKVELWNASKYRPSMCWTSGFRLVTANKWTKFQAKALDRGRMASIRRINLLATQVTDPDESDLVKLEGPKSRARQIVFYGKPFSYYFHVISRRASES